MASTYNVMQFYAGFSPTIAFPLAREAAQRALQLDDSLAEAHAALARVAAFYDWEWASADREFKRAIELHPNNADVYHSYSRYLAATGRVDEALENDPNVLAALGHAYAIANRRSDALRVLDRLATLATKGYVPSYYAATVHYPGCKNRSKGPRFRFLCEEHLKLPKKQEAALAKWAVKNAWFAGTTVVLGAAFSHAGHSVRSPAISP